MDISYSLHTLVCKGAKHLFLIFCPSFDCVFKQQKEDDIKLRFCVELLVTSDNEIAECLWYYKSILYHISIYPIEFWLDEGRNYIKHIVIIQKICAE